METDRLLEPSEPQGGQSNRSHIKNLLCCNIVVFILTLASTIYVPVIQQYLYRRVSEDIFNKTETSSYSNACYVNKSDPDYILQEKAQSVTSAKQMHFTILNSSLGIISNIMLGVYSDYMGRKILFLIPIMGHLLRLILTTVIIHWSLDLNFFFLSEGVDGMMGGFYGIIMAAFVYTADNTPPTGARTIGVAFAEVPFYVASACTSMATGYFIQETGFFYPALTASLLCLVDLIVVIIFLPTRRNNERRTHTCLISPLAGLKRVFGFYVLDGNAITKVCFTVVLLSFVFNVGLTLTSNVDTLFVLNQPFCWSPEKLGLFQTITSLIGPLIGIPFTRLMQCCFTDEVIGVIGSGAVIIADVMHSLASTDFMLYAVAGVVAFGSTVSSITRAILSRMVPSNRQGSLFASIAVIEALCTLVGNPIFSSIYQNTVAVWRGLVFLAMVASHVIAIICLLLFICIFKRLYDRQHGGPQLSIQESERVEQEHPSEPTSKHLEKGPISVQ